METKDPKSAESVDDVQGVESKDPKSDATSSETLSDVLKDEKASEKGESEASKGEASTVPSPDGAFDDGNDGSNGIEDAGPM
jgi:hypothetical protein